MSGRLAHPINRVVVPEDTNGDGKMDKRRCSHGLNWARKVLDSVLLVGEPNLWLMDTSSDPRHTKESVTNTFGAPILIEHNANGAWAMTTSCIRPARVESSVERQV